MNNYDDFHLLSLHLRMEDYYRNNEKIVSGTQALKSLLSATISGLNTYENLG